MLNKKMIIANKLGLHARASMQIINRASRYSSDIQIIYRGRETDAKDILQVMSLGASKGSEVELKVTGDDETEAMRDLEILFAEKFGEE